MPVVGRLRADGSLAAEPAYHCPPYVAIHQALAGKPVKINAPGGVGDHIHAQDVARGLIALLEKDGPFDHSVYNVAQGEAVTLGELLQTVAEIVPGLTWEIAPEAECDIVMDPRFAGRPLGRLRHQPPAAGNGMAAMPCATRWRITRISCANSERRFESALGGVIAAVPTPIGAGPGARYRAVSRPCALGAGSWL